MKVIRRWVLALIVIFIGVTACKLFPKYDHSITFVGGMIVGALVLH